MIAENQTKPVACWRGKERYDKKTLECLTIIFESGGCSWAKCRMCSYRFERYKTKSCEELSRDLHAQLAWVRSQFNLDEFLMIKIFTSGSFFDPDEVPLAFQKDVAKTFREKSLSRKPGRNLSLPLPLSASSQSLTMALIQHLSTALSA